MPVALEQNETETLSPIQDPEDLAAELALWDEETDRRRARSDSAALYFLNLIENRAGEEQIRAQFTRLTGILDEWYQAERRLLEMAFDLEVAGLSGQEEKETLARDFDRRQAELEQAYRDELSRLAALGDEALDVG